MALSSNPDPLGLFLHAHLNPSCAAEHCLGVIEKQLLEAPRNGLLLGCKAALLLIIQSELGLAAYDGLYRRNAIQMACCALERAGPLAALHIRLMNGIAWARGHLSTSDLECALSFLQVLEDPQDVGRLPPLIALEGHVALAIVYKELGQQHESAARYSDACTIDEDLARDRYGFFQRLAIRHKSGGDR